MYCLVGSPWKEEARWLLLQSTGAMLLLLLLIRASSAHAKGPSEGPAAFQWALFPPQICHVARPYLHSFMRALLLCNG